ncbi:hypothetical protein [Ensifer adhaerens]|uniref:hypothetical protein n=1 Tax=Ensifer adhaerens TaxID=106592 RepID=UPI000CF0E1DA|nr:hypothetical protein [Ensifer adhaerens]
MDRPDLRAFQLRQELQMLLRQITDEGSPMDSGGGLGSEDIWCVVDGHQFHIQISHDVKQLAAKPTTGK